MHDRGEHYQLAPARQNAVVAEALDTEYADPAATCRNRSTCTTLRRLDTTQQLACCGDWEYDVTTGAVIWSQAIFRLLRREPSSGHLTFEEFLHCYPEADAARLLQAMELVRTGHEQLQLELWPRFGTGFPLRHRCTLMPQFNQQGHVECINGFLQELDPPRGTPLESRDRDRIRECSTNPPTADSLQFRISVPEGTYEYISPTVFQLTGYPPRDWYQQPLLIRELLFPGWRARFQRAFARFIAGETRHTYTFPILHRTGEIRWLRLQVRAFRDRSEAMVAVEGNVTDITALKREETQRKQLIRQLRKALADIKHLGGLIPICSHCKKVRDDRGLWQQLEQFLAKHGELLFSHGICPDCLVQHYPHYVGPTAPDQPSSIRS
jgi:PAS domain S-box-containing protein